MSTILIRDPIHVFVELNDTERRLIDSQPFQRLRHLHQLATTFLIFPSATHKRFEHCIGVMELAKRIYRVIVRKLRNEQKVAWGLQNPTVLEYYERVVGVAALCHDLGHLPFSHGIESLLEDIDHENLSRKLIEGPVITEILSCGPNPVNVTDVVKLALERDKVKDLNFTPWEEILNQVITGECFGADRMDYLLRDSYHLGVSHGHFDHHRLIECLRVLPLPPTPGGEVAGYALGIEEGGLRSAEALLLARYMMFSQVYYHKTRIIFDFHLKEFIGQWLGSQPGNTVEGLLELTDNDVFVSLEKARRDPDLPGHQPARRLLDREHFRRVYQRNPADDQLNDKAFSLIETGLREEFGELIVAQRKGRKASDEIAKGVDFPVHQAGANRSISSLSLSQVLLVLPQTNYDYLYASKELRESVRPWLDANKERLLKTKAEEKK